MEHSQKILEIQVIIPYEIVKIMKSQQPELEARGTEIKYFKHS